MRTWAKDAAETDEPIVLIINDNGHDDLLHHTFQDTQQDDQERGRSKFYEVPDVGPMNIDPGNLQPSSIHVGIRGEEAWIHEDFFVFGEENGSPIPLALARKITKILSTEQSDGEEDDSRLSIPIPPVILGNSTTPIFGLLVLMLTDAGGTDSRVQLHITTTNPSSLVVDFDMLPPSLPDDSAQGNQFHQKANQASFYYVEEETGNAFISSFTKSALDGSSIQLSLEEADDSWLPASFFLFGIDTREEAAGLVRIVPLVHKPVWDQGPLGGTQGPTTVTLP
jgi:hypothetical protein